MTGTSDGELNNPAYAVGLNAADFTNLSEDAEPDPKRRCAEEPFDGILSQSVKDRQPNFPQAILDHLEAMENKVDSVADYCQALEEKVEMLSSMIKDCASHATFLGSASPGSASSDDGNSNFPSVALGSSVTLITLNSEEDYPDGSWLGDENNVEMRVRCRISPTDAFHINTTCRAPEKMALTLLDYLFDRETQACSNISGTGKHKKKQLDPLMIYGIRCHLIHKFNITANDWHRIKQNLDSKCRTAFRRKQKGLALQPKASHVSTTQASSDPSNLTVSGIIASMANPEDATVAVASSDGEISNGGTLEFGSQSEFQTFTLPTGNVTINDLIMQDAQVITTQHGDIQVLHATPEQLEQIQQTHQIQILTGGHILATPVERAADRLPDDSAIERA